MLLSPDSPQLCLGKPDEEKSTEPHVRTLLLHPAPTFITPLLLSFTLLLCLKERGCLTPPLLSVFCFFSSTELWFPQFSQGLLLNSLLRLPPFLTSPQSKSCDESMAGKEMANSWSLSSFSLPVPPIYFLLLKVIFTVYSSLPLGLFSWVLPKFFRFLQYFSKTEIFMHFFFFFSSS